MLIIQYLLKHFANHVVKDATMLKVHQLKIGIKSAFGFKRSAIIQLEEKGKCRKLYGRAKEIIKYIFLFKKEYRAGGCVYVVQICQLSQTDFIDYDFYTENAIVIIFNT